MRLLQATNSGSSCLHSRTSICAVLFDAYETVQITSAGRSFEMMASSEEEVNMWVDAIKVPHTHSGHVSMHVCYTHAMCVQWSKRLCARACASLQDVLASEARKFESVSLKMLTEQLGVMSATSISKVHVCAHARTHMRVCVRVRVPVQQRLASR